MSEQVQSISFSGAGSNTAIKAELDSVFNDSASQFAYKESAYFRVYPYPDNLAITITPSAGEVYGAGDGSYTVTETVTFDDTNLAATTYPIQSIVSTSWYGNDLGGVVSKGNTTIQSSKSGIGVLSITYTSYFKRFRVRLDTQSESTFPVLLSIQGGTDSDDDRPSTSLTVTFYQTSTTTTDYLFTVQNYCTDTAISGVGVYIDGVKVGTTDSNGQVTLSDAVVGESYTAYVSEGGYRVFEATFTVPTPSTDDSEAC
jgi:hypothetical protein